MRKSVFSTVFLWSIIAAILLSGQTAFADPSFVSWWKLDEGRGSTAYDSAGSNDGTITGATWTTGQITGALEFNDAGDYIDVGNDVSLKPPLPLTLSAWVRPSGSGDTRYIITVDDQTTNYYGVWFCINSQNTLSIGYGDGGSPASWNRRSKVGTTVLNASTWYHAVAVIKGGTDIDLYVNGFDDGGTYSGTGGGLTYSSGSALIGNRHDLTHYFNGKIDDVRVYKRALSAGEIEQLYIEGLFVTSNPNPPNGGKGVDPNVILSWKPGMDANSHDVYLGTDYNDVNDANTNSPEYMGNFDVNSYDPCGLDVNTTYFWRIDEVNEPNLWRGDVWSFEIRPEIELSATQFEFYALEGGSNPNDQILGIFNSGVGALNWGVSEDCDWLSAEPNSGSSTGEVDDVNLSVDISGLAVGSYECNLTISDPNASNNPQTAVITLYVSDSDGTLYVPSEYSTIQAAIDVSVNGDVVIVAPGTYTGSGNYNLDFGGKAITVRSTDPEDPSVIAGTVIDCQNYTRRGFYFHNGEDANSVISGLTIKRGKIRSNPGRGGGIYCVGASPTIRNCTITSNTARGDSESLDIHAYGGGICCISSSHPIIINCAISNNRAIGGINLPTGALGCGGGIYSDSSSSPEIIDCVISGNDAVGGYGDMHPSVPDGGDGYGGGIFIGGTAIIENCVIVGNRAIRGMAGYWDEPGLPPIYGSDGHAYGGGIRGGGVSVTFCTILSNSASTSGDGINCTSASTITNNIIWDNGDDLAGSCSATYCCIEDSDSGTGNIHDDPCFATGPEGDYYLSQTAAGQAFDSPCVDAGSDLAENLGMDLFTTRTDQLPDRSLVDMGYHCPYIGGSADIDENRHVDFLDFALLVEDWLKCSDPYDSNCTGAGLLDGDIVADYYVDIYDLEFFVSCWLDCYVTKAVVIAPYDNAVDIEPNIILNWSAGDGAMYHDVYFGTDANAVADANHFSGEFMGTISETSFAPNTLDINTTYYWRIDEVGAACMAEGDIWNFTTRNDTSYYLVGWWMFDEGSGSTAYDSAGDNDGNITGATWTSGQIDGALDFNGVSDYVEVADAAELRLVSTDFTISAWVRPDSNEGGKVIVSKRNYNIHDGTGSNAGWATSITDDELRFTIFGAAGYTTTGANIESEIWQHVAYVFDDSNNVVSVYKDGDFLEYLSTSEISLSNKSVIIGAVTTGSPGPQGPFDGKIDDVRIYDRALSTGEIEQLYQQAGPIAHWKFDEGSGTTAYDSAGNNDGTLVNGPVWTTGQIGGALDFNAVDDYVSVPDDSSLDISGAITISIWLEIDEDVNTHSIVKKISSDAYHYYGGYRLLFSDGTGYSDGTCRMVFQKAIGIAGTGSGNYGTNTNWDRVVSEQNTWESGEWYHFAATWDGTTDANSMKMYINGVLNASHTAGQGTIKVNDYALMISAGSFDGKIDDVRIYDRALSEEIIEQLYEDGL